MEFICLDEFEFIVAQQNPAIKNNNITHLVLKNCYLRALGENHLRNAFQNMNSLTDVCIYSKNGSSHGVDDNIMTGFCRVFAVSLANPECRLERLSIDLDGIDIGDEGVAILTESLRSNQRLTHLDVSCDGITENGWNAFLLVLCDTASINATHGSNHTLVMVRGAGLSQNVEMMLQLNSDEDKSRVAANKILHAHRHLDMRPLFDWRLALLPRVVAWLERFAESRLDLKLSSIFEFVRAMPMNVVDEMAGEKSWKRKRNGT